MKNILIFATVRSGHNFIRQQIESWDHDEQFIIGNFEDVQPQNFEDMKYQIVGHPKKGNGELFNYSLETIKVVIVRDLLNWWASYLQWIVQGSFPSRAKVDLAFKIWTSLTIDAGNNYEVIPCIYDVFKDNEFLRRLICNLIGGKYTEENLDVVPPQGGGSSFDKISKGSDMKTDLRYKMLSHELKDFYMRGLRSHPKAIAAYTKYFTQTVDQKSLLDGL